MLNAVVLVLAMLSEPPNILFCIADDWGWPHAGAYGDAVVATPAFDRVAREGVVFDRAYVSSPSCTPSRNAILTGQYHWRLGAGASLWSTLDVRHPVYPLLLQDAGYHVGHWRKSWGPGRLALGGYTDQHPAGVRFNAGFESFLDGRPEGAPFCFWLGASDPHRPYKRGSGRTAGIDVDAIVPPLFYPNTDTVRSDIADYYVEVQRFDTDVANAIKLLEERGELENTIVVVTGDHGMPFPRCKTNIYEMGVHVPLAIRWGARIPAGARSDAFVSLCDLAPTFLAAAGVSVPPEMTGESLLKAVDGIDESERTSVVYGMERHAFCRAGNLGYPCRGIRTENYAYIRNYEPDRWPVGDPPIFGDCDPHNAQGNGLTKGEIIFAKDTPGGVRFFELCFAKRPAEELYDMRSDPDQLINIAGHPAFAELQADLALRLQQALQETGDPRAVGEGKSLEGHPYYGGSAFPKRKSPKP